MEIPRKRDIRNLLAKPRPSNSTRLLAIIARAIPGRYIARVRLAVRDSSECSWRPTIPIDSSKTNLTAE